MASHTPIYQKIGNRVVPVITIDDAPSSNASAAGHLVDSNGIAKAIADALGGIDGPIVYNDFTGATSSAAGKAGLVPAPAAGAATRYLRSDGTWQVPPDTNTTYSAMTGATSSAAGKAGLVPAPAKGRQNYYLKGDGTWVAASWLPLTGGTLNAANGTAGTAANTGLTIGNNKSIDVAGNSYGYLRLFGKTNAGDSSAYYSQFIPSRLTANRTLTLPNSSGYVAVGPTNGVGSASTPVYLNASGVLTACTSSSLVAGALSNMQRLFGTENSRNSNLLDFILPPGGTWLYIIFRGTGYYKDGVKAGGTTILTVDISFTGETDGLSHAIFIFRKS